MRAKWCVEPTPDHARRQLGVLHEAHEPPGRAVERPEPHVAAGRIVVGRAVVDDRQAQHVAVEGDRPLEVAADRRHVVQPAQLHALLIGHVVTLQPSRRSAAHVGPCAAPRRRPRTPRRRRPHRRPGHARRSRGAAATSTAGSAEITVVCERKPARCSRSAVSSPPSEPSDHPADEQQLPAVAVEVQRAHDEQHDPDQHAQLHERDRVPRRLRAVLDRGPAAAAAGRGPRLGRAVAGGPLGAAGRLGPPRGRGDGAALAAAAAVAAHQAVAVSGAVTAVTAPTVTGNPRRS